MKLNEDRRSLMEALADEIEAATASGKVVQLPPEKWGLIVEALRGWAMEQPG